MVNAPIHKPRWAKDRQYLTGYFLIEEAAGQTNAGPSANANLEIYPPEIQESLRMSCDGHVVHSLKDCSCLSRLFTQGAQFPPTSGGQPAVWFHGAQWGVRSRLLGRG